MGPEARATTASLARLLAEIRADRKGLTARLKDSREAQRRLASEPKDPAAQAMAGVAIHAWYTGFEAILERVARELDGTVPSGDRWHRDLLYQASAQVPGLRQGIFDSIDVHDLTLLLAFRHFFRHAYAVEFDSVRLGEELMRLQSVAPHVDAALDRFEAFLSSAMSATDT